MKLTGEIGKKLAKRALIVGGTVLGISLVATLAKSEPEDEEELLDEETEVTEEEESDEAEED